MLGLGLSLYCSQVGPVTHSAKADCNSSTSREESFLRTAETPDIAPAERKLGSVRFMGLDGGLS